MVSAGVRLLTSDELLPSTFHGCVRSSVDKKMTAESADCREVSLCSLLLRAHFCCAEESRAVSYEIIHW